MKSVKHSMLVAIIALVEPIASAKTELTSAEDYSYGVRNGEIVIYGASELEPINISKIEIPDSINDMPVTTIGSSAFEGCTYLHAVKLPNQLKRIENSAFADCPNISSFEMPDGVESIGHWAFKNCSAAISLNLPSSWTEITENEFSNSGLRKISIPDTVKRIGNDAFLDCYGLTNVCVSDLAGWCGISFGGATASPFCCSAKLVFNGESITNLVIPDVVTRIGAFAFYGCSGLAEIAIGDGVEDVGLDAFGHCPDLVRFNVDNGNAFYRAIDGVLFSKDKTILVAYPARKEGGYVVPDGVVSICDTFSSSGLTSLTIPDSVTNLQASFESCDGLLDVVLGNGVMTCPTFGKQLLSLSLGNGISEIRGHQFREYSSLTNISLGNNVQSIGDYAFYGCQGLKTITIPASVTSLGSYVFGKNTVSTQSSICPLSTVYLMEGSPLTRGTLKAAGMRSAAKVRIRVSRNAYGAAWTFYVDESGNATIENIVPPVDGNIRIPEDIDEWPVVGIEKGAFANCTELKTLMIPAGITSIGEQALIHCTGLEKLFLHRDCTLSEEEIRSSVRLVDTCEIVRWTSVDLPVISSASVVARPPRSATVRIDVTSLGAGNEEATVTVKIAGISSTSVRLTEPRAVELTLDGIPFGREYSVSVSVAAPSGLSDARSLPLSMTAKGGDWSTGGSSEWTRSGGNDSAEWTSGPVSKGETCWLELPVEGKGRLAFSWKVSAGRGDYCRLYVDGAQQKSITRSPDWSEVAVDVSEPGEHVFRWTYERGTGDATGDDAAAVRNVAWSPETVLSVTSAYGTSVPAAGSHSLRFGDAVSASVAAPEDAGGVRRVCTGWTGTGSVPEIGTGTNLAFTIEEESSVVWTWRTDFRCEVSVSGGTSGFGTRWIPEGTAVAVEIVPDSTPCSIAIEGDVDGVSVEGVVLRFVADRPRTIRATVGISELTLEKALDAPGLAWTTDGDAAWYPQTDVSDDGVDAAKSGSVLGGSEVSALQTTVSGTGTFSWSWKADAAGNAGVDVLLDGTWLDSYEPGSDWSRETLEISGEGTHVVRFEFWNAGTESTRNDCAYIDRVSWSGGGSAGTVVVEGVAIPTSWIEANASAALAAAGGDREAAATATAANGRPVWECYVADLDPEDPDDDLVATISMAGGVPEVSILKGGSADRDYAVQGALAPGGPWGERNDNSRFFRVKVSLKEE
ncbi:MAG: leucine-rich repeat domain-containing protein [Kiritimatiellae bacterium]|nr:leucine-rich repeat domain-containing protein [Kiritimatiellia bacterium]